MAGLNPSQNEYATWGNPQDTPTKGSESHAARLRRNRDRITTAKRWREEEKYDDTWKRLRDIYRLKPFQFYSPDDRIAVAIAFSTINVIAPSVAVNYPKITVKSQSEDIDQQNKAAIVEAIANYWWRHFDFLEEHRRVVQDFLIYGHGWGKVGWRYKEEIRPLSEEEQAEMLDEQVGQTDQFGEEYPDLVNDLPQPSDVASSVPDAVAETLEDKPFFERVSPFDLYVDPEATSIKDAQWIAQRIVLPLDVAKKDERFSAGARRKLSADGSLKWFNEDSKSNIPDDHGRVTVWEFYDLIKEEMCIFADQQKDVGFLVKPTPFPYAYGHPFVMLRNYEVPDQFYTIGEIEAIEPLQNELNHTRSAMVLARQLDIPKYMIRKDALGVDGLDALTNTTTNGLVPVLDDTPFNDVIAPVPNNGANAQFYANHSEIIESDIDRVTGVNEYMRGALPEVRRTATEASIIQDAANARAADKLARIEHFIAEVSERLVQLAQQFMTAPQVARISNEQGTEVWVPYNREDIEGQFDFEVEAGSTQPQNETFRRQQAVALMNTMAPFVGQVIDPAVLATHVLREGFGIKNPERFIMAPPPMMPPEDGGDLASPDGAMPPAPQPSDGGASGAEPAPSDQMAGQMSALQAGAVPPPMGMP
jgi:hypothetical protein